MTKVAPSILSADFSKLGKEVNRLEACGADWVHIDVMDGNFVPNITIGPVVIKHIRKHCSLPFDVHLMISDPKRYLMDFSDAGADIITIHAESTENIGECVQMISDLGEKKGLSISPDTPFSEVTSHMEEIDLLLIMTVYPGFAGQVFMRGMIDKIKEARDYIEVNDLQVEIQVDGGINSETAPLAVEAGADVLAAGSSLFGSDDMKGEIGQWKALG